MVYNTGSPGCCLVMTWRDGMGWEAEKGGDRYIYTYKYESFELLYSKTQ